MTVVSFWISIVSFVIGIVAIVIAVGGILRAEALFKKLDKTLELLIGNLKNNILKQTETVFASYASFSRSLQFVDLKPEHLPADGAFALLTVFYLQKALNAEYTEQQYGELRTQTRKSVENAAAGYVKMLVKSGLADMKPGFHLPEE